MPNPKRARQKAARAAKLEEQRRLARRNSLVRRVVIIVVVTGVVIGTAAAFLTSGSTPASTSTSTTNTTFVPTSTTSTASQEAADQSAANNAAVQAGCPAKPSTAANHLTWTAAPSMSINTSEYYYATFKTTAGTFVVKLNPMEAPVTVNNFVFLADHKYYNCGTFFRVIPGFVVQGGAPGQTNTDASQPGYTIPDELQKHPGTPTYPQLSLAMANTGQANTGGSQFFIVTGSSGETLANSYTLFGQVVSGQNVPYVIVDFGSASGTPKVTERVLTVTISTVAPAS